MKFLHVAVFALVAMLSLGFVAATEREVRSYTSDMEYVDHVELNSAEELPVAASPALMETSTSSQESTPAVEDHKMSFFMDDAAMIESAAESEIDTEVMRAMALEIHDAAQANLNEEGEVASFVELSSDADADSESESESDSYADSESDSESESYADSEMDSESESYADSESDADMESEVEYEMDNQREEAHREIPHRSMAEVDQFTVARKRLDPNAGLTPQEVAQEITDKAASKLAAIEEKRDQKESQQDKIKAKEDAKVLGSNTVRLPKDLSAEHGATLRANEAATRTIGGALKEMGAILHSKDDTIRSLVYNISYLTVNIGKLANKLDESKAYIKSLEAKLNLSKAKVHQLKSHVAHSKQTASSIRAQLKSVEARLNNQDAKTNAVDAFLNSKKDNIRLPKFKDDLKVVGQRRPSRRSIGRKLRSKLRPVAGTQTVANTASVQFRARGNFPFPVQAIAARAAPAFFNGGNIPTIVIEREDDGM